MKKMFILATASIVFGAVFYVALGFDIKRGQKNVASGKHTYLIVLGAKVKPGGVPSLSLQYRLDAALDYLKENPKTNVIVSGGQGPDEEQTEASFMRDYLIANGIEKSRIITEEQSTSTYENLYYSFALLPETEQAVTIVSSDFHLRRATYIANKLGYEADVIVAKTPKSVEVQLNIRERLALLRTYILGIDS